MMSTPPTENESTGDHVSKSTKSKALAKAALAEVLPKKSGGYIADILAEADALAVQSLKRGNNVETRKAAISDALAKANKKAVAAHLRAFKNLPGQASELAQRGESISADGMSEDDAIIAMRQALDIKLVKEMADASYDAVKEMVFHTMNLAFADEEFPEHTNGVLDVPELGKRFCREGAGRKEASLDEAKLAELIGDEAFESITTEKVVVARVVDEEKLAALVADNPALLEAVRAAVKPGDWKSPRLWVRDIPADEIEQE